LRQGAPHGTLEKTNDEAGQVSLKLELWAFAALAGLLTVYIVSPGGQSERKRIGEAAEIMAPMLMGEPE